MNLVRRIWLKLCRKYSLNKWISRITPEPVGKKWVFIVGSYNSGTTLLNELLALHPDVSALPYEGVSLASKLNRPEDLGWPRMWHKCQALIGPQRDEEEIVASQTKREWASCFDNRKTVYVEKSIVNSARIPWLMKYFQPAYFVHIVRNGYAVSEGIRRRTKKIAPNGEPYPIELCAEQWKQTNISIRNGLQGYDKKITVTYEELTDNTQPTLIKIAEFLELNLAELPDINTIKVHGEVSTIVNRNEASLDNLTQNDKRAINEIAKDELEYFGYLT